MTDTPGAVLTLPPSPSCWVTSHSHRYIHSSPPSWTDSINSPLIHPVAQDSDASVNSAPKCHIIWFALFPLLTLKIAIWTEKKKVLGVCDLNCFSPPVHFTPHSLGPCFGRENNCEAYAFCKSSGQETECLSSDWRITAKDRLRPWPFIMSLPLSLQASLPAQSSPGFSGGKCVVWIVRFFSLSWVEERTPTRSCHIIILSPAF